MQEDFTVWKPIDGYKLPYRVNDMGEFQYFRFNRWNDIKPRMMPGNTRAVLRVTRKDGVRINETVVRIIAELFLGGWRKGYRLLHLDGNPLNNSVYNLKWVKQKYIAQTRGARAGMKCVEKIDADGNVLDLYPSIAAAAKANYMTVSNVSLRCHNRVKNQFRFTDYGFRFEKTK